MLREHLSQEHDRASRRLDEIDRHVSWIQRTVLGAAPSRVLDLGCGPGFYAARLARLGHTCVGIDYSPASVAYARSEAEREALACEYRLEDLLAADFGSGFDLALLISGELNAFRPSDAQRVLAKAHRALRPSGALVLEVHTERDVRSIGARTPTWFTAHRSVFSDEPHLCLQECAWLPAARAATERYYVVGLRSAEVATFVSTAQAYSEREYTETLRSAGFGRIERHSSLSGDPGDRDRGLFVWIARCDPR